MNHPQSQRRSPWPAVLLFGGLWLLLCRYLALHWQVDPQYSFGWMVPPLALFLAGRRWRTRPVPGPPLVEARWVLLLAALAFLPTWVIAQPNPDWRFISWALALEVVALLLAALAVTGGRAWLRHLAFPACFILAAVPWPTQIEVPVVLGLMHTVAAATVSLLNLCGIAALQQGNLIAVSTGVLGVDEACSGVRSLQATFMAALFLGEMYRFRTGARWGLIGAGLGVAFVTNVGRALILAWQAAREGLEAAAKWHDTAGFTLMTICFLLVWMIALILERNAPTPPDTKIAERAAPLPAGLLWGLTGWFVFVFAATEGWYRSGSTSSEREWTIARPTGAEALDIEPAAAEKLKADRSQAWTWRDAEARPWLLYDFEWNPGPVRARVLARMHRPEVCLPSAGLHFVEEREIVTIAAGPLQVPFRAYTFERDGLPLHVYFCLWEDGSRLNRNDIFDESLRMASLQPVLRRQRGLRQHVVELAVSECRSAEQADAAFRVEIGKLLERTPGPRDSGNAVGSGPSAVD